MDYKFKNVKQDVQKITNGKVEEILSSFPELNNGENGLYDITALQVAAAFTLCGVTPLIGRLISHGNINQCDQLGRTPLHYASINGNAELVELLLDKGADMECRFLYRESTLRTSKEDYRKWNKLYTMLPSPDGWGRTPLHEAAKEGHTDTVKLLIKRNANVNAQDEKGVTPLLLAGSNRNKKSFEDIVELLVGAGANVNVRNSVTGTTPLFHAVAFKSTRSVAALLKAGAWLTLGPCHQTELHEAAANGLIDILEMFLEDPRVTLEDINMPDDYERTPLCRAAHGGYKDCLRALINKGGSLAHVSQTKESVMDVIFARIGRPAIFIKDLLDSKITGNHFKSTDEHYRVTLDFSVLAPHGNDRQMDVISNILVAASEQEKVELLQHPLIESFLRLKWYKIRQFFFLLIFSYTAFVLSLSVYVVLYVHYHGRFEIATNVARYFVIVTAGGLSGHAIIQCVLVRRNFLKQYELLINLICTVLSVILAIYGFPEYVSESDINNKIPLWTLHASSIAVLLAWTELMLLIGRFPTYGYYALMFAAVLQNVIKVLLTFVCLVIGFALSFSIQFRNYEQFANPWRALVKTTVMMMGEFEYGDLFEDAEDAPLRLHTTSRVIFLLFIILASIVLMNLMVGVAVSDIQGLQQEGHAIRLEKQAEFLHQLEKVISCKTMQVRWFPAFVRNFLKRKRSIALRLTIQPEHTGAVMTEVRKTRKLPYELVESIIDVAASHQGQGTIFKNIRIPDLVEALKIILQRYDRRMTT